MYQDAVDHQAHRCSRTPMSFLPATHRTHPLNLRRFSGMPGATKCGKLNNEAISTRDIVTCPQQQAMQTHHTTIH